METNGKTKRYTDEQIVETLVRIKRGEDINTVAKAMGANVGTVIAWFKKSGVEFTRQRKVLHDWDAIGKEAEQKLK